MKLEEYIKRKLVKEFKPILLEVVDESYMHHALISYESHFTITIVSDLFIDKCLIKRHRMIYSTLSKAFLSKIHALALHTYSINEWENLQDKYFISPSCLN